MAHLRLDNLSFSYRWRPTIDNISCTFETGRFYGILGPNGSGKTTLLDLICGYLSPGSGRIMLKGQPLHELSKKKLSQQMALVAQDYTINFPFHVKEVVLMGRHPYIPRFSSPGPEDLDKADDAMKSCGILHLKDRKITELSGGEKQRCIFARALCQDTPILLLDEAFSSMDIHHTLHMLKLLKVLVKKKNKTVISVLHDFNLASIWTDEVLLMKNGKKQVFGDTQDVLTQGTILDVFNINAVVELNDHVCAKQIYFPEN